MELYLNYVNLAMMSYLVDLSLARHEVPESQGDGPKAVASHGLDDLSH